MMKLSDKRKRAQDVKKTIGGISFKLMPGSINFILLFIFVCYIVFTNNESGLKAKINFTREIKEIEAQIQAMQQEMRQDSIILNKIKKDNNYLERYAREQLYMSRPDEIIYKID